MLIATWNLNSIRSRKPALLAWLERVRPDVVCLQELKTPTEGFPFEELGALGYRAAVHGQATYNGVAIASLEEPADILTGFQDGGDDSQARFVTARVGEVRVVCAYVPNGGEVGSDKWAYKLAWMARLRDWLERHCDSDEPLALCGDLNIAPDDADVARPAEWAGSVLTHGDARAALARVSDWGLFDVVRAVHPDGGPYTWWDYRNRAFELDNGLRIDHVLLTAPLAARVTGAAADREERGREKASDHAPLWVELDGDAPRRPKVRSEAEDGAGDGARAPGRADRSSSASAGAGATGSAGAGGGPARARPRLMLIDGHSLAYRAFYGLPLYDRGGRPSFTNRAGEFTNAVYGFVSMLIKSWAEESPDYIAVAFDLGRTFRDDLYAEYKGTREKMPEELVPQIDRIVQLVEAFGLPAVAVDGFEADDILGTLAARGAAEGMDVVIVTGDSDAFQLIDANVRVVAPGRLWTEVAAHDEEAIVRRYGLRPAQLVDYKALVGDSSDNIPGVRGIGEKSAGPLLAAYGTIEGVYEHLDEVTPNRVRNALEAGRELADLSKRLVTIRRDVPLDLDWQRCAAREYDRARVLALFDELEFRSIRDRLPKVGVESRAGAAAAAGSPADGPGRVTASGQLAMFGPDEGRAQPVGERAGGPGTEAVTVRDEAALASALAAVRAGGVLCFDTETTGTDPMRSELVGIALTGATGRGAYVPVGHTTGPRLDRERVLGVLRPLFADEALPKVAHNAKFDIEVLRLAGLQVRGPLYDTMLAQFVLDPGVRLGLKALARSELGIEMTEITELIGVGREQITMADVPIDDAARYAAADVDVTLRLRQLQEPRLAEMGLRSLLDDVELPLIPALVDAELAGVLVDVEMLAAMSREMAARLARIEAEVYEMVGVPFNLSSPQQLARVLFDNLGLEPPGGRRTQTGQQSVAADVLDSLRGLHPVVDLVLEHRHLSKLKGTYVDALPAMVNPRTGRVHTSYNQTGAVSGRLSSQDPNLQNIPIRTEQGREIRRAFIVPPGWRMIAADYSQVELRIAAHLADDPGLKAAFAAGQDIHRATAATVLGIPPEVVTPDQRSFAKRVNFGLLYGMGARSLASQAGIPVRDAQEFVDAYFRGFPNIRQYIEDTKRQARERGYVETLLGRRRYFPVLASATRDSRTRVMQAAAEREAINHPMQGTAADIIKIAMARVHRRLQREGHAARLLLQVHDELVLEAPEDEVQAVTELVRETMESAWPLDPALKVDIGMGANWLEVK